MTHRPTLAEIAETGISAPAEMHALRLAEIDWRSMTTDDSTLTERFAAYERMRAALLTWQRAARAELGLSA